MCVYSPFALYASMCMWCFFCSWTLMPKFQILIGVSRILWQQNMFHTARVLLTFYSSRIRCTRQFVPVGQKLRQDYPGNGIQAAGQAEDNSDWASMAQRIISGEFFFSTFSHHYILRRKLPHLQTWNYPLHFWSRGPKVQHRLHRELSVECQGSPNICFFLKLLPHIVPENVRLRINISFVTSLQNLMQTKRE